MAEDINMGKEKPLITFESLLKDMEMDAVEFKEKYGCEKSSMKMILDKMWMDKLSKYDKEFEVFEGIFNKELAKQIKEVELFEVGHHNGKTFTQKDVDEIYESTKKVMESQGLQIPIKLGHSKEQGVAKSLFGEDAKGMPALGWVKNLKKEGNKIIGDLVDIPDKLYKMLKDKMWNSRSIELWEGFVSKAGENVGSVITGLALLGAETPAVTSLATLFKAQEEGKINLYSSENQIKEDINMSDEIKETVVPEKEVAVEKEVKVEAEVKDEVLEFAKLDEQKRVAKLREMKKQADEGNEAIKALAEFKREQKKTEDKMFLDSLEKEGKILPFHKAILKAVLPEVENKDVKYFDKAIDEDISGKSKDLLKEFLKSLPNLIDYQEFSKASKMENGDVIDVRVKDYMAKNTSVKLEDAYKAVCRENNIDINTL